MTGDLVPNGDPHWENFLLLLTITDYALLTLVEIVDYVKTLIKEHRQTFKADLPIIPKMHYNVHLPEWMKNYVIKYTVIVHCLLIMITLSNASAKTCHYKRVTFATYRFDPPSKYWCMRYE